MKLKVLSLLSLAMTLSILHFTLSSSDNGIYQNGSSCGGNGCHGTSASTSTTCTLSGLPANFVTGQTYTLTFTCVNTNTSLNHGGFNILCSAGLFTAGTGSKTNGNKSQITHNTVSSTNSWTFTWTAPATTAAVNFQYAGNCVDNDGNENASDLWNTGTLSVSGNFPTSIDEMEPQKLAIYPNPVTHRLMIDNISPGSTLTVYSAFGQPMPVVYTQVAGKINLTTTLYASGFYTLLVSYNGQEKKGIFFKN